MSTLTQQAPLSVPVDDEHAGMMNYALSPQGQEKIAKAQAEIDRGLGIAADQAYFEALKARRVQQSFA